MRRPGPSCRSRAYDLEIQDLQIDGDWAFEWGSFSYQTEANGKVGTGHGKVMRVMRRSCFQAMRLIMKNALLSLLMGVLCLGSTAGAQQTRQQSGTVADSINYIWKDVERDMTTLAEAMPDDAWVFKPRTGAVENVRTFAEQIKHVACSNFAFADQTLGERPPEQTLVDRSQRRPRRSS
jgi:hypothetical protein